MLVTDRTTYYSQPYVLFEIVKQLKYKYLSVRKQDKKDPNKGILSRYYLGYSVPLLQESLIKNDVLNDKSAKIYGDLTSWRDEKGNTPMFNFNREQRKEDKENFNKEFEKYMVGFDFAIDLDSNKDPMLAWKDAKKIKDLFDEYKLPYSLKFSGSRGFHFLIEDRYFSSKMKAKNKVILFGKIARIIMVVCGLKSHAEGGTFDDSIYDDRRIFKLPYSLCNNNGIEYVCLPLSDIEFNNWKLENMKLENVMRNVKLFKRGSLTRTYGLSEIELKKNVQKFTKECKG